MLANLLSEGLRLEEVRRRTDGNIPVNAALESQVRARIVSALPASTRPVRRIGSRVSKPPSENGRRSAEHKKGSASSSVPQTLGEDHDESLPSAQACHFDLFAGGR